MMQTPDGPICCFLKYVYMNDEYRKNLTEMNETFFLDSGRMKDPEIMKDKEILEKFFSFKKIWEEFDSNTKNFIMRSMRGLVLLSTKYIQFME